MKTEALPDVSNDLLIEAVQAVACPLTGAAGDYDPLLDLIGDERVAGLRPLRLERAIGVIYRPETERASHYFHASLTAQFDAILHFDRTRAVEPLECSAEWQVDEVRETFPSGI